MTNDPEAVISLVFIFCLALSFLYKRAGTSVSSGGGYDAVGASSPTPATSVSVEEWTDKLPMPPRDLEVTSGDRRLAYVLTGEIKEADSTRGAQYIRQYVNTSLAPLTAELSSLRASLAVAERDRERLEKAILGITELYEDWPTAPGGKVVGELSYRDLRELNDALVMTNKSDSGITDAP